MIPIFLFLASLSAQLALRFSSTLVGSWQLAVGSWQLAVGSWQKNKTKQRNKQLTREEIEIVLNFFSYIPFANCQLLQRSPFGANFLYCQLQTANLFFITNCKLPIAPKESLRSQLIL